VPNRKYCEATTVGTDGVVVQTRTKHMINHTAWFGGRYAKSIDVARSAPPGQAHLSKFLPNLWDPGLALV
jgi:hypothetical protein